MNSALKLVIGLAVIVIWTGVPGNWAIADDDREGGRRKRAEAHERHEEGEHREHGLKPVDSPAYAEACGACHFAYQPELLPAASWEKILAGLNDHFGEPVEPDEDARRAIGNYLTSNSAETGSAKLAVEILRSLEGRVPMRITDTFYIQKKHRGIPADVFRREPVGSFSNCCACHPAAADGVYDEDGVRIPR